MLYAPVPYLNNTKHPKYVLKLAHTPATSSGNHLFMRSNRARVK